MGFHDFTQLMDMSHLNPGYQARAHKFFLCDSCGMYATCDRDNSEWFLILLGRKSTVKAFETCGEFSIYAVSTQ